MELRQLKYFIKTAETLSFSEASKALCITQSTLSQQIKQLETELGTPLFIRFPRSESQHEIHFSRFKQFHKFCHGAVHNTEHFVATDKTA